MTRFINAIYEKVERATKTRLDENWNKADKPPAHGAGAFGLDNPGKHLACQ